MEYKTAKNMLYEYARYIRYLVAFVVFLLVCNSILGLLLWHQSGQEKTVLIPANLTKKAMVSDQGVDANYLMQCALFFVDARLNVTPSSVFSSQKVILAHTAPKYYAAFKSGLERESESIKAQKISSTFYISDIKTDPKHLSAIVSGNLRRWVGERALADSHKEFKLRFNLVGNEIFLISFQEVVHKKGS